ncbi:MAG: diguanylate cyclase [Chloroflexi bacterium]|nr:diguanylate cyclase [Chloroflexota bacterium]
MSRKAIVYISGVIIAGAVLSLLSLLSVGGHANRNWPLLVLLVLNVVAHLYITDTVSHEAWAVNLVFLFAGVLLLESFGFVLLVIIPHLVEWGYELWVRKSDRLRNAYIQPFNIAMHLTAGFAARTLFTTLQPDPAPLMSVNAFLAALAAMLVYLFVNHAVIGSVLILARGITLRASGVFEPGNLAGDLLQFGLGYVVAGLWTINPVLILPAVAPLALMHRAIQVPKLAKEAHTDAKTGLLSMRRFNELVAAEIERAKRFARPLGVVMADLDLLRNINNTYGHLAGDAVLTRIGQIIRDNVREYDLAARFGGEEFSIVLLEAGVEEARTFANRVRRAIESAEFVIPTSSEPIHVTMSLGVACFPVDADTQNDLIQLADVAVYQAKLQGRNCVVCAADVPRSLTLDDSKPDTVTESNYQAAHIPRLEPAAPAGPASTTGAARPAHVPATRPSALLRWFILATIVIGLALTVWGLSRWPAPDPTYLLFFLALTIIAELLQVNVYGVNTVSISVTIIFAAGLLLGLPGVVATSAAVALTHYVRVRPQLYQATFNWATHVIAGALPALAAVALSLQFDVAHLPLLLTATAFGGLLYYAIDTSLIAVAIGLSEKRPLWKTWRAQFGWLVSHYLVLCGMGLFLAIALNTLGVSGGIVFALPPFMMHYAQKQYVARTEESARELRRMNQELTHANQKIVAANQAIQNLNDELFLVLAKIVDARDPFVSGHTTKVADYAMAVAAELGVTGARAEAIRQAALLHDIGKIGVSEQILHKSDQLSPAEYTTIKSHTMLGADLLETCQGLRHLAPFVRHHHEWWDGNGYPYQLKGEATPLEARLLAVCDAVEAMASDRPYNRAMSLDEIIAELRRCAGTQFDPHLVDVFIRVARRRGNNFVVNSAREVVRQQAIQHRFRPEAAAGTPSWPIVPPVGLTG